MKEDEVFRDVEAPPLFRQPAAPAKAAAEPHAANGRGVADAGGRCGVHRPPDGISARSTMAAVTVPLSENERLVAEVLRPHRGKDNPVARKEIERRTGLDDRSVKGAIAGLSRDHGWKIGRLRVAPGGYFLVETLEDFEAAMGPYARQALTMLAELRRWLNDQQRLDLAGQARLAVMEGKVSETSAREAGGDA